MVNAHDFQVRFMSISELELDDGVVSILETQGDHHEIAFMQVRWDVVPIASSSDLVVYLTMVRVICYRG